MNLYLGLLASLVPAVITKASLTVDPDATLTPSSLDVAYRCASSAEPIAGRRIPTALDCLNVLTFVLATTPNHKQPTKWSRHPDPGHIMLPYRRSSGTCQFLVRLTTTVPSSSIETASFDQVVAAALRIIEVCILIGRADERPPGGVGLGGMGGLLDIVIWGAPDNPGNEGVLSNETVALNGSAAWIDRVAQS